MQAGTIIPPKAAAKGRMANCFEESEPAINSCLISNPTKKKKITIRPSLTQWYKDILSSKFPKPIDKGQ